MANLKWYKTRHMPKLAKCLNNLEWYKTRQRPKLAKCQDNLKWHKTSDIFAAYCNIFVTERFRTNFWQWLNVCQRWRWNAWILAPALYQKRNSKIYKSKGFTWVFTVAVQSNWTVENFSIVWVAWRDLYWRGFELGASFSHPGAIWLESPDRTPSCFLQRFGK